MIWFRNGLEKQRAKEANTKEVNEVSIVKEVNDIKENLGRRKLEEQNWKAIAAASLDKRDNKWISKYKYHEKLFNV